MRVELNGQKQIDANKIWSFVIDFLVAFVSISLINLLVVRVFNLSPTGLLEKGIETSLYESKMTLYDWISIGMLFVVISYIAYFRKFFSVGDMLLAPKE